MGQAPQSQHTSPCPQSWTRGHLGPFLALLTAMGSCFNAALIQWGRGRGYPETHFPALPLGSEDGLQALSPPRLPAQELVSGSPSQGSRGQLLAQGLASRGSSAKAS